MLIRRAALSYLPSRVPRKIQIRTLTANITNDDEEEEELRSNVLLINLETLIKTSKALQLATTSDLTRLKFSTTDLYLEITNKTTVEGDFEGKLRTNLLDKSNLFLNIGAEDLLKQNNCIIYSFYPQSLCAIVLGHFQLKNTKGEKLQCLGGDVVPKQGRLPNPGLLLMSIEMHDLRVEDVILIGDGLSDIKAARAGGLLAAIVVSSDERMQQASGAGDVGSFVSCLNDIESEIIKIKDSSMY